MQQNIDVHFKLIAESIKHPLPYTKRFYELERRYTNASIYEDSLMLDYRNNLTLYELYESLCCVMGISASFRGDLNLYSRLIQKLYPQSKNKIIFKSKNLPFSKISFGSISSGFLNEENIDTLKNVTIDQIIKLIEAKWYYFEIPASLLCINHFSNSEFTLSTILRFYFNELENEAYRLLYAINENQPIPITAIEYHRRSTSGDLTFDRHPYNGRDFFENAAVRDELKGLSGYTLSSNANPTRKDLAELLKYMILKWSLPFVTILDTDKKLFQQVIRVAFGMLELKWQIDFEVPYEIYKLEKGDLTGSEINPFIIRNTYEAELIYNGFSVLMSLDFNSVEALLAPSFNINGRTESTTKAKASISWNKSRDNPELKPFDMKNALDRLVKYQREY